MDVAPQWVMAVSTLVLVVVTGFYAWRTSRMATATRDIADATYRSVEIANAALVLQHAPIVIPRSAGGGGSTASDGIWGVDIAVSNIGGATAFGVAVKIVIGEQEFGQPAYPTLDAHGEPRQIKCRLTYGAFKAAGETWCAEIAYADLLGRSYRVVRSTTGQVDVELEGKSLRLVAESADT